MNSKSSVPPEKEKPPAAPQRRVPGPLVLGILIFLVGAVLVMRLAHQFLEGGIDEAAANLATYAAGIVGLVVLWAWVAFRSTYPRAIRWGVGIGGVVVGALLIYSVRLEGITGNWVPTGMRGSWDKPRDYARPKPTPLQKTIAAQPEPIPPTPDDFPQFLGPHRNGYLPDVQLSHDWESTPPKLLWRKEVGAGWSGFTVVADRAVTMEQYGDEELVTCRDLETGEVIWSHAEPARHQEFMGGIGPRCTPTIHESKVYALGATGIASCLHLSNGQIVWQDNLRQRYGVSDAEDLQAVMWGRSNSPLVYGQLCIIPAGGKAPKSLIAYDKDSGKKVWEGGDQQISYASPVVLNITGKDQIVTVNEATVAGHDPESGQELWSFPWPGKSNMNASASQPHLVGINQAFISKGYDEGSAVFQVAELGGEYRTEQIWKDKRLMQTKFTNAVIVDGYAYGLSDGIFQCIDVATGKKQWMAGRYGHGQILAAGDVILVQTEKTGELVMLAIDPAKHRELGRTKTLNTQSQAWNNLCLAGKKLLLRNADEAVCFELP